MIAVVGDERSGALHDLRAVYRTTLPDLYGYVLFHSAGDTALAEDITAETYLTATQQFGKGRGDEVTLPWLKVVAKRKLIDHWRRQRRLRQRLDRLRNETDVVEAPPDGDDGPVATLDERQGVYDALQSLPDEQRLVLVLRHLDGLPVNEIADMIDRTPKATESLLGRARVAFRRKYESRRRLRTEDGRDG
ncbi:MAG: RNA polymerase sigma factor [Actinomycetota bacterium]